MIEGLKVVPLRQIEDNRGKVLHMLRADSPLFGSFGEIYFSVVNPGKIKAWKRHLKMTQHFAVPVGMIRLVIYDDRSASGTCGNIEVIETGESDYKLIRVPPLLWYGFTGISEVPALIANCTDIAHSPEESERLEIQNAVINYDWGIANAC